MKIALILSLFICSAYAQSNPFVGRYGYQLQSGVVMEVGHVFVRGGDLRIKFERGCTASLKVQRKGAVGSCVTGRGYDQVLWEAKLNLSPRGPILTWRNLEYGNREDGFDGFKRAFFIP